MRGEDGSDRLGPSCSMETSNAASFWRVRHSYWRTKNPYSFQSWPDRQSVNAGGKLVSDSAKRPLTIGCQSPAIQGRPPDVTARAHLRFADLPSSASTLCLSPGKPVIYYELRRELGFKRMPLEANVEPELDGKVMPAFICEVRTQFLFVAFA